MLSFSTYLETEKNQNQLKTTKEETTPTRKYITKVQCPKASAKVTGEVLHMASECKTALLTQSSSTNF